MLNLLFAGGQVVHASKFTIVSASKQRFFMKNSWIMSIVWLVFVKLFQYSTVLKVQVPLLIEFLFSKLYILCMHFEQLAVLS